MGSVSEYFSSSLCVSVPLWFVRLPPADHAVSGVLLSDYLLIEEFQGSQETSAGSNFTRWETTARATSAPLVL